MATQKHSRRLSIDITEEQDERLKKLLPWGMKTLIFRAVVDDLIETLEKSEDKNSAVGAIIGRHISVGEWSQLHINKGEEKDGRS